MTIVPAALGAFFTANLEQIPPDVTGYFSDRSATYLPVDPPLHEIAVSGGELALVAAEPGAVAADRLFTNETVCALSRSRDARFHAQFQPICALVLVALLAILPGHAVV